MAILHLFRHDHLSANLTQDPKIFIVHNTQHKRCLPFVFLIWNAVRKRTP